MPKANPERRRGLNALQLLPVRRRELRRAPQPCDVLHDSRGCSTHDVPYTKLAADLASDALPAFSFITPNLIHDMHNGTVADGNQWLATDLPTILASPEYKKDATAIFITWDEGEGGSSDNCAANTTDVGCHVAALVISPSTPAGSRSVKLFNHYSLLATAEQLLGLPKLGRAASDSSMVSAFNL